jgi:hypothetical protein
MLHPYSGVSSRVIPRWYSKNGVRMRAIIRCVLVAVLWLPLSLLMIAQQTPTPVQNQLPDAPKPQETPTPVQHKTPPWGKLPAILAPQITKQPINAADKFRLYVHQATNPVSLLLPAFWVGLTMANPPDHYPREWKNGAGGFGRLYGNALIKRESQLTAETLAEISLREDPRYLPSASHNAFVRTAHAVAFVIIDRSDSGHNRLAFSNFSGAAASGLIGMAYLPAGYNDIAHAGQSSASTLSSFALSNIANEFCPEWGPIMLRMHLPFVHPPCAERIRDQHLNNGKVAKRK